MDEENTGGVISRRLQSVEEENKEDGFGLVEGENFCARDDDGRGAGAESCPVGDGGCA